MTETTTRSQPGMTRALTLLFAVSGGAAVGNLYWAQPLLGDIAGSFGVTEGTAGLLVTVTQLGYALGIFLIVPLGDVLDRRRLIPSVMVLSAVALAASAAAPTFLVLLATLACVGLTTVAGQLLTPLAGDLASPEERGRVVGTVASGLLTGILLSRTISGVVADAFGWRSLYVLAAVVVLGLAALLWRRLPSSGPRERVSYATLLGSVFAVVRHYPAVRATLLLGAAGFGVFTLFWTALTFLLTAPPFSYSLSQIGLVGLVGLAGAVAARQAGRLHDRGWSVPATGLAMLLALVSLVLAGLGSTSLVVILAAVLLLDVAVQAANVLNQTRLFSVEPDARSRLNTAYVTGNFFGGACGSAAAGVLWHLGGWVADMTGGAVVTGLALAVWALRRTALATPARH